MSCGQLQGCFACMQHLDDNEACCRSPLHQHPTDLQGATLDRNAECCTSGNIDACGACDGKAKLVDAENR